MADGVRIDGLRKVTRDLQAAGVEVADLKAAFTKIGDRVITYANPLVPRRTGRLAASLRPAKAKNKSVVRAGSAAVPYAGAINYGWPKRGIRAAEFLTRPANDHTPEYVQILDTELSALMRKHDLT